MFQLVQHLQVMLFSLSLPYNRLNISLTGRWKEHGANHVTNIANVTDLEWGNIKASICESCLYYINNNKCPPYSLMGGYDFGNMEYVYSHPELYNLTPPTELEMQVLAKYRMYCEIIKLVSQNPDSATKQSRLVGHVVVLPSDGFVNAFDTLTKSLPSISGDTDFVKVCFVGTREQWTMKREKLMNKEHLTPHFTISRKNTLCWMRFIKAVNPEYKDVIAKFDWNEESFELFRQQLIDKTEV